MSRPSTDRESPPHSEPSQSISETPPRAPRPVNHSLPSKPSTVMTSNQFPPLHAYAPPPPATGPPKHPPTSNLKPKSRLPHSAPATSASGTPTGPKATINSGPIPAPTGPRVDTARPTSRLAALKSASGSSGTSASASTSSSPGDDQQCLLPAVAISTGPRSSSSTPAPPPPLSRHPPPHKRVDHTVVVDESQPQPQPLATSAIPPSVALRAPVKLPLSHSPKKAPASRETQP